MSQTLSLHWIILHTLSFYKQAKFPKSLNPIIYHIYAYDIVKIRIFDKLLVPKYIWNMHDFKPGYISLYNFRIKLYRVEGLQRFINITVDNINQKVDINEPWTYKFYHDASLASWLIVVKSCSVRLGLECIPFNIWSKVRWAERWCLTGSLWFLQTEHIISNGWIMFKFQILKIPQSMGWSVIDNWYCWPASIKIYPNTVLR